MKYSVIAKTVTATCVMVCLSLSAFASQKDVEQALKAGQLAQAVTAYQGLSSAKTADFKGQLLWARILLAQDKTEDAYDLMEELLKQHSNDVDLQFRFGQSAMGMAQKASIFSKLGYAKDGVKAWNKALEIDANHENTLKGLIGFHRFAPGMAGGDIEKALAFAQRLKKINGPKGVISLVGVYQTMEKEDLAQQELNAGIELYPDNSQLFFLRGMDALNNKQWTAAYNALNVAAEKAIDDDDKSNALYQLGKLGVKSGENTTSAITSLTKLMTMSGHRYSQWGNLRLAQLYTMTGDLVNAKSTLSLVDDDDDDDLEDEVKKLKKQLRKLTKKR